MLWGVHRSQNLRSTALDTTPALFKDFFLVCSQSKLTSTLAQSQQTLHTLPLNVRLAVALASSLNFAAIAANIALHCSVVEQSSSRV